MARHQAKRVRRHSDAARHELTHRRIVTTSEAARLACVTCDTIRQHIENRNILAIQTDDGLYLISATSLMNYYPDIRLEVVL